MHLLVRLRSPRDPSNLRKTWVVVVTCAHGSTSTPWRRACRDGCHLQSAAGAARCRQVTPPQDLVVAAGMIRHGLALRCGCDAAHWMARGPHHHQLEESAWIQDKERRLPADEEERLRQSLLLDSLVWDPLPLDDPPWDPA
jgi:hypothetical protein